jgi:hypothetical protein
MLINCAHTPQPERMDMHNVKSNNPHETEIARFATESALPYLPRRLTRRERSFLPKRQPTGNQPLSPGTDPVQDRYIPPRTGTEEEPALDSSTHNRSPLPTPADTEAAAAPTPDSPPLPTPEPEPKAEIPTASQLIHTDLNDLPASTREKIIELVERNTYEIVTQLVTAPMPEGLGLKTSKSSIQRFVERHRREERIRQREQASRDAKELLASAAAPETLTAAASCLIRHRILRFMNADGGFGNVHELARTLRLLSATDQAERRLRLAEAKFAASQNQSEAA